MEPLEVAVNEVWPLDRWKDVTVVVGVSGGPDSVALLRALCSLRCGGAGRLVVAHFEHGWRRDAEKEDAEFVEQLAATLGLRFERGTAEGMSALTGAGREATARVHRFAFFERVGRSCGARYLALGHTRDDQVETILHRIIRGTGPIGLAGIPRFRQWFDGAAVVRPMLGVSRTDVMAYLLRIGQAYRIDSSNEDRSLTRNRIRHELLPLLRSEYNSQVDGALARLGEWGELYREWLEQLLAPLGARAVVSVSGVRVEIDCRELAGEARLAVIELLRRLWRECDWPAQSMDAASWQRLAQLVVSDKDADVTLPGAIRACRRGYRLVLERS